MRLSFLFAIPFALVIASPSFAGVYSDTKGKCLVSATTEQDQIILVKWIFSEMTLHPAITSLSSVTPKQRDELNKKAGELFNQLLTVSCRRESSEAIRYEGATVVQASFQILGQVAVGSLMSHPIVTEGFAEFGKNIDEKAIIELSK